VTELAIGGLGKIRGEIELAIALDQMIQLLINFMQLEAQFTRKLQKILNVFCFAPFSWGHVEKTERHSLKRIAHDPFGKNGTRLFLKKACKLVRQRQSWSM